MIRSTYAAVVLFLLAGCGGRPSAPAAPEDPEATVRSFLAAVNAGSLSLMGQLWGGERGPARTYMQADELEKRLTVIRTYLEHQTFEVVRGSEPRVGAEDRQQIVEVRLTRNGCTPVVPFTLIRYGAGWLVNSIDLEAAGNPARRCQ